MAKINEMTIDCQTGRVYEGPPPPNQQRILCMPMKKNVPVGQDDWKEVPCPKCGRPCWERPVPESHKNIIKMCTECAVRTANKGDFIEVEDVRQCE
jgi:hypothetical protein